MVSNIHKIMHFCTGFRWLAGKRLISMQPFPQSRNETRIRAPGAVNGWCLVLILTRCTRRQGLVLAGVQRATILAWPWLAGVQSAASGLVAGAHSASPRPEIPAPGAHSASEPARPSSSSWLVLVRNSASPRPVNCIKFHLNFYTRININLN